MPLPLSAMLVIVAADAWLVGLERLITESRRAFPVDLVLMLRSAEMHNVIYLPDAALEMVNVSAS